MKSHRAFALVIGVALLQTLAQLSLRASDPPTPATVPVVSIAAVDWEARESVLPDGTVDTARFRLARTGAAEGELAVFFAVGGTAEPGMDYERLGRVVFFKAGARTTDLVVLPLADRLVEGDESVVVELEPDPSMGPIEHYRIDPNARAAKAVIHDDDRPAAAPSVTILEPTEGAVFVANQVITIAALAIDPAAFIARLEYSANGEKIGESAIAWAECVGCEPKPGDPARHRFEWKGAAPGRYEVVARATHRVVFDPRYEEQAYDPPLTSPPVHFAVREAVSETRFSIVATRSVAEESSWPYRRVPLTGELMISRKGDLSVPALVFVHYGGTAQNGVDYEALPWAVKLAPGEAATRLEVRAVPDKALEGTETLIARLSPCPPDTDPPLGIPCVAVEIDPAAAVAEVIVCEDALCDRAATVRITAPQDGDRFAAGAVIPISAVAIDPRGAITRVEFWADAQRIGVSEVVFVREPDPGTPVFHEFLWKEAPPGRHVLSARARDAAGAEVVSAEVQFTVAETAALRVAIVKPLSGAVFTPADTVEVRAVASGAGSGAVALEIRAGGRLLGSAKESELAVTWANPPVGVHILTAQATDAAGQVATSEPVKILVRESVPVSFVRRDLPPAYTPGRPLQVTLVAVPPRLGHAWAVADRPPSKWQVEQISDEGVFDAAKGEVKFGPFTDMAERKLTYVVTPPENAQGRYEFTGEAAFDGIVSQVTGDRVVSPAGETHPADLALPAFAIDLAEVTRYAAAWKEGKEWPSGPVPIPPAYVTRAGMIWRQGERYLFDPSAEPPECWVPKGTREDPTPPDGVRPLAERTLTGPVAPGREIDVQVAVVPGPGVSVFAVEEQIPEGWTFNGANAEAKFDAARRQIRWGPFYRGEAVMLRYQLVPPADVASLGELAGRASFDGRDQAVSGIARLLAGDAASAVAFGDVRAKAGGLRLQVRGQPGQLCQIEVSTDLIRWLPLQTVFVLEDGKVEIADDVPLGPARFFRVRPSVSR